MSDEQRVIFSGNGGPEECAEFVRSVREYAFGAGKVRDNAFIADFVSTCFVAPAFFWYEELDEDVRHDWNLLRKALIDAYGSPNPRPDSAFIPTPAAAPPHITERPPSIYRPPLPDYNPLPQVALLANTLPPTILDAAPSGPSMSEALLQITITTSLGPIHGYVSKAPISNTLSEFRGCLGFTSSMKSALCIRYVPSTIPSSISIQAPGFVAFNGLLGAAFRWPNVGPNRYGCLVPLDSAGKFPSLNQVWTGPKRSDIWTIASDGTVGATWNETRANRTQVLNTAQMGVFNPSGSEGDIRIFLAGNYTGLTSSVTCDCSPARLHVK